jgi:RNA polymerase sigma factor (TIGR02999 family)
MASEGEVTKLLRAWRGGDAAAFDALVPLVYRELHKIASAQMRGEDQGHTLSPTGLLHESFLKLMQTGSSPDWQDRKHFYVVAAGAMRRLLVDHARRKKSMKRSAAGGVNPGFVIETNPKYDLIDLDRLLVGLAREAPRRAQMIELRYFGGLSIEEVADVLGCSMATVGRELRVSEAWLAVQLRRGQENPLS